MGIGTHERAKEFCNHVNFPVENLYADPENAAYSALGLKMGITDTFFNQATPFAIADRFRENRAQDLIKALSRWKPWIPPKLDQGLQQGGMFVFLNNQVLFSHYDPATGAHADISTVLSVALEATNIKGSDSLLS